jgi:predicted AAA+ superfamily ATPase
MAVESVVVLEGPRAVGKSTLLRTLAERWGRDVIDLDDLSTREAVRADPALFVRDRAPILIDEFQHVPELLDAIKAELNRDNSPGRYVLTGSTRYATLPAAAQPLTGRAHRVQLLPFSQGEIGGTTEHFAQRLLSEPDSLLSVEQTGASREECIARILTGGFPPAVRRRSRADRTRWFDDYVDLVIERDVMDLSRVRQRRALPLLLRRLASQTGQVLNIAHAAQAVGIERSTAENYTRLLEAVFLIHRLPAWGRTIRSRVSASPKVHVVDSGLAARLLRLTDAKLEERSASALNEFGHLLETFAVGELCRQLGWLDQPTETGHWRTHDGEEVDLVIERDDGRVAAVEVKAGSRVTADGMRSLNALQRQLGDQVLARVLLYTGDHAYRTSEGAYVLPVSRLWEL